MDRSGSFGPLAAEFQPEGKEASVTSEPKKRVLGWTLTEESRAQLLKAFPPRYPDIIADHITLASGADQHAPRPTGDSGEVIGRADDGEGVEALVVRIAGTSNRPDGGTYHITWSLDAARGRTAKQSNDVIREHGWTALPEPAPIHLKPASWTG